MNQLKRILGVITFFALLTSCSNDSTSSDNVMKISAKATYTPVANRVSSPSSLASGVVLTSFKINIDKIEFKLAGAGMGQGEGMENHQEHHGRGDENHDGMYNGDDEAKLNGPWELDLLNQTAPVTTVTIANGTYEEVEFKLNKSLVADSPLFNKTVEIKGTINGIPFVFWHNFEQKYEIDYHDATQNLVVSNSSFDLLINIDVNKVLSQIDLSTAVDGNSNGIIEIGPDDTDGNNALALQLNTDIEHSTEMEDHNHHH